MSSNRKLPVVVDVPTPCEVDWEDMVGDERGRHCAQCGKTVRNLSVLDADEISAVLARGDCVSFLYREDASVVTAESGIGAKTAAVMMAAAMALTLGCDAGRTGGEPVPVASVESAVSAGSGGAAGQGAAAQGGVTAAIVEPVSGGGAAPSAASAAPSASCAPGAKVGKDGKQVRPERLHRTAGVPMRHKE